MKIIYSLICLLLVFPVLAQDPAITPDESLILEAPDGWAVEIEDFEATQAKLEEQGITVYVNFPGLPVTLISDDEMTANIDITLYYGQDWDETFGTYIIEDAERISTEPDSLLRLAMDVYDNSKTIDEIELQTLILEDGRTVFYYDVVDTFTSEELSDVDMSGAMDDAELGVDSETLDESLQSSVDTMTDMFDSITTTSRYYALSFDNTGVIFIEVSIASSVDTDNEQFGAMMNMMAATEAEVEPLMEELLNGMQAGPGFPIYEETEETVTEEDTTVVSAEGLIIPDGWIQLTTSIEDRLVFSDDPDADADTFSFAPDKTLILIQMGELARSLYENNGANYDQSIEGIARDIALIEQSEYGLTDPPEIQEVQVGAITTYSFSLMIEPFVLTGYFYERPNGEFAFTYIVTQQEPSPELLRPLAILINSLG